MIPFKFVCPQETEKVLKIDLLIILVADTVDEEDDGDWWTSPPAMFNPSLPPEVEDNGEVVLAPTPTDVQPEVVGDDLRDTLVPDTPSPGKPVTLGEDIVGEEMEEVEEEEKEREVEKTDQENEEKEKEKEKKEEEENEKKQKEMEERKATVDKVESGWEKDATRKTHKQSVSNTTGLVSSLFLLVACLTGILTLRL